MANLKLEEIQGVILRGYKHHRYSNYIFFQIEDAQKTKEWLSSIIPEVTTSVNWPKGAPKPQTSLNIAFSYEGLKMLGYEDTTNTFSREFQDGMSEENRARTLGDTGESDPSKWEMGGPTGPLGKDNIHIMLLLYGKDWASLDKHATNHRERISKIGGMKELYEQDSYINEQNEEPFGFRDGLSQPEVEGFSRSGAGGEGVENLAGDDLIKAGEFILGYPNAYNELPITPTVDANKDKNKLLPLLPPDPDNPNGRTGDRVRDFGQNGTYLVYRKLEEDVAGFWRFMNEQAGSHAGATKLAAQFMGRWQSGTPLVLSPDRDDLEIAKDDTRVNNFKFHKEDPDGFRCPKGSHIRRSNPRDSQEPGPEESLMVVNRHRIIRRGRPYGMTPPDDPNPVKKDKSQGIIFIAINASIKRQFEFVQQMWVNDQKFDAMYDNKDGITGDCDQPTIMTLQCKPVRKRILNVPRFVTVRGGGYFFLPSITALKYLASGM
jgi:Dyp-type peroxidase family